MSSTAYHHNAHLNQSGASKEAADDPWLDDQTTTPYRRNTPQARKRTLQAPIAPAPALPPLPERLTRPGFAPVRSEPATGVSRASTRFVATPRTAASPVPPTATAQPKRPQPSAAPQPKRPQPSAAWPNARISSVARTARPRVITSPNRITERLDRTVTRKRSRAPRMASEPALTPAQLSQRALEELWRDQVRPQRRGRTGRALSILGAVAGAVLCSILFSLFTDHELGSVLSQRLTKLELGAHLLGRQRVPTAPEPVHTELQPAAIELTPSTHAGPATLRIDSKPWARVFVDDVLIGNTPQLSIQLDAGIHHLRLYNPELARVKHITLELRPGETVDRIERLDP